MLHDGGILFEIQDDNQNKCAHRPSSLPSEKEFGFLVVKTDGFLRFCQNIRRIWLAFAFCRSPLSRTFCPARRRQPPSAIISAASNNVDCGNGDVRSHFSLQVAILPSTAHNNGLFTSLYCQQVGWTDSSSSSVSQGTTNWNQ